jgi:hypothetical protein
VYDKQWSLQIHEAKSDKVETINPFLSRTNRVTGQQVNKAIDLKSIMNQ